MTNGNSNATTNGKPATASAGKGAASDEPTWGLFYRENTKDLDAKKSNKVKLPIRQHIRLHALKLFTEKNISETVEKALDAYFATMKAEEAANLPPELVERAARAALAAPTVATPGDGDFNT
ncbi:MAG: hypothetical protein ACYDCK_15175 [Thermoplasmatota archaeon]